MKKDPVNCFRCYYGPVKKFGSYVKCGLSCEYCSNSFKIGHGMTGCYCETIRSGSDCPYFLSRRKVLGY